MWCIITSSINFHDVCACQLTNYRDPIYQNIVDITIYILHRGVCMWYVDIMLDVLER